MGAQAARSIDSGNEWATPWEVVQDAMRYLGIHEFDLDPAATPENAKATKFYTREQDGLKQPWFGMVWLNPPFSRPEKVCRQNCKRKTCVKRGHHVLEDKHGSADFAKAAVEQLRLGRVEAVAWHGPVATDTQWLAELWPWVHFRIDYNGRIRYNAADSGGTFPIQTLILRPRIRGVEAVPTILKPWGGEPYDGPQARQRHDGCDSAGYCLDGDRPFCNLGEP